MTLAFCTKQIFYIHLVLYCVLVLLPIPVADGSKTRGCSRSRTGIAGSNPAGVMDVFVVLQVKSKCKTKDNEDK
jgi:hypothetical protein